MDRDPKTFTEQAFAQGIIQSMNLQTPGFSVIERKAGILVGYQPPERGRDGIEQLAQIQRRDDCVINIKQKPQAIVLFFELLLHRLRLLEVKRVLDGYGDLRGDLV